MEQDASPLLLVACRFVPYDQWLVTHIDPTWRIKQVKHWLLSKCNLASHIHASDMDLPRYRPISPITFASGSIRPRKSFESNNESEELEDEDEDFGGYDSDGVSSLGSFEYSYGEKGRRPKASQAGHSVRTSISGSEHRPGQRQQPTVDIAQLSTQYTLVTFSVGQILEDEFLVSWYNIRSYELLEMHLAGAVVNLPREVKVEYVKPYFEGKVKWLRVVWGSREASKLYDGSAAGKVRLKTQKRRSRSTDPLSLDALVREREREAKDERESAKSNGRNARKENGKRRTKYEWRERWIVIHQGVFNLCRSRTDPNPTPCYPLSLLCSLRGAEHVPQLSSTAADPRIVCMKFNMPTNASASVSPQSIPSSPIEEHQRSRGGSSVDEEGERNGQEEKNTDWVVLDMLEDNAFTSFLRILHRHSPHGISSSFLPSITTYSTLPPTPSTISASSSLNRSPTAVSPSTPTTPHPYHSTTPTSSGVVPLATLPYPEWRISTVERAQKAGMGDVGKAMEALLLGESASGGNDDMEAVDEIVNVAPIADDGSDIDDSGSAFDGEDSEEYSDAEWEGWMRDLERQARVKRHADAQNWDTSTPTSPRQIGHRHHNNTIPSSPLSSSPESDSRRPLRSLASTLSSSTSSAFSSTSSDHFATHQHHRSTYVHRPRSPLSNEELSAAQVKPHGGRMTTTITSTVSVGTAPPTAYTRRRSSTVTAAGSGSGSGSKLFKRKEKGKEKEASISSGKPKLSLALSNPSSPSVPQTRVEDPELAPPMTAVPTDQHPRRTSILRHVRSGSNLHRKREDSNSQPLPTPEGEAGGLGVKKRSGIVRGVSMQAERFARGLDSALDFVDGRVGFGAV